MSSPAKLQTNIRRVAILFSGGPAPAANAVISTAAAAFIRNDIEVYGILNGYSNLLDYNADHKLQEGRDYILLKQHHLKRTRNSQGILIGTSRANPGINISEKKDITNPQKTGRLQTVYQALNSLKIDALISIGGDGTLRIANLLNLFQENMGDEEKKIKVIHLPKTIDNDYTGIDFTFGYFTAVDTLANEIFTLLADAESTQSYYVVQTMGRSAGWLAYGAGIAGEASLVISIEDLTGKFLTEEEIKDPKTGKTKRRSIIHLENTVDRIVDTIITREKEGKKFGVIVLAEGLTEYLPNLLMEGLAKDENGFLSLSNINLVNLFVPLIDKSYTHRTGCKRKFRSLQLGYESRCVRPHAYDVMLGSQIGVGAFRALIEKNLNAVMVSCFGQLNLKYIPFEQLIDQETLSTVRSFVDPKSDFHFLARFMETYVSDDLESNIKN